MSTDKGPPKREAPTGTTYTDHEAAALLDELWNEVPHNDPQTLKDGILAIIQQLKMEHEVEVDKIKAEHDHQIKLTRIDHLQLVISLKEEICEKDVAISKVQLEKESSVMLRDYEIKNLKKDYQEAIQGYIRRERELETDKAAALQGKKMASDSQQNSIAEAESLRREANELRLKCISLQHKLSCVTQREESKNNQLFNIERKRSEEKEELQRAKIRLASMESMEDFLKEKEELQRAKIRLASVKSMEDFLEGRNFLSEPANHRPLSWLEMERAIRVAAYGAIRTPKSNPTMADSLINSSRLLVELAKHDREYSRHWHGQNFFACAYGLIAEIMETVQTNDNVRKAIANDALSINRALIRRK